MAITFALCMLPFWLLESVWLIRKRPAEQKMLTGGLMGRGKEWKLLRRLWGNNWGLPQKKSVYFCQLCLVLGNCACKN
jgi:hypothetical protein